MKQILRLILVLVVCVGIAIGSYSLAMGLMNSIYNYRSPLSDSPPIPGQSLGKPMARQVVIVLVDGLRYDTFLKSDVMPNLSKLRSKGAFAKMHSRTPSYSSPGYGVLLTGAWPEISDAPAFNLAYENIRPITQDNLFSSATRLGLKTAISALNWFEKLIPPDAVDSGFFTAGEDSKADREVVDAALPWLGTNTYQLVLIHLDQVDYAGHHEGGPENQNWNKAASRVDRLIGEILKKLDLEKDIILVVSDHGHIDVGGHGGQESVLLEEPFLMAGKGVVLGDYGDFQMVDVAPTVAAILGINVPASSQGQARIELFGELPADIASNLPFQTANQQSQLLQKYATAIGAKLDFSETTVDTQKTVTDFQQTFEKIRQKRLNGERILRFAIGILAILIIGFLLIRWKFFNGGWLFFGAIMYTVLFHLYYFILGPKLYSYSVVISETKLILSNGLATLLIFTGIWVFFTWRNRTALSGFDLAAFSGFLAIVTAGVTFLPVIIHWVWNGLFADWTLPVIGLHYLAILSLIQILFLGLGGIILSGVSVWIGRKRKVVA